jgi:hypothetical protein
LKLQNFQKSYWKKASQCIDKLLRGTILEGT